MSLDINLVYKMETYGDIDNKWADVQDTWHEDQIDCHLNITHNLGEMASKIQLENYTLYDALWRPYRIFGIDEDAIEEFQNHCCNAKDLIPYIQTGLDKLKDNPSKYKKYDSPNGWGLYDNFVPFVEKYLLCIIRYPNATIEISR